VQRNNRRDRKPTDAAREWAAQDLRERSEHACKDSRAQGDPAINNAGGQHNPDKNMTCAQCCPVWGANQMGSCIYLHTTA
jgi:hypothetical protein